MIALQRHSYTSAKMGGRAMAYHYESARKFYLSAAALCKLNFYNLMLHKHLGDVFYAIGAKEEFEATYKAKLRFIVRPQHEFLMQMWEIKDYSIYDLNALVKKNKDFRRDYFCGREPDAQAADRLENEMFQAVFPCVPAKGVPFVCESLINNFFSYPRYWSYRWATNMGIEEDFCFGIPKHKPQLSTAAKKALVEIAPLDKIVLFALEAATATEFAPEFWDIIAERVHSRGYKIIVNSDKYKIKHGISAFDLKLSLQDVVALGLNCAYVFALRSGLCDVLVGAGEKLYAFYPAMLHREMNSLNKCFEPMSGVNEVAVWRWKIDGVIWEGEDLTPALQKYINKLHRSYLYERVKTALSVLSRRRRNAHKFWYRLFRDLAGKSNIFPENNIENAHHKYAWEQKITLLGLPIYRRQYKCKKEDWRVTHKIFGGLIRFKRSRRSCDLSVLGLRIYAHNQMNNKYLFLRFKRKNQHEKWFARLQSQIDPKYDDIYLIRHNIGESYIELLHIADAIKVNGSKHPLLVVWNRKNQSFYEMFKPKNLALQYIQLEQSDIHDIFGGKNAEEPLTIITKGRQRFICSTPRVAQNMKRLLPKQPDMNFYDYINDSCGVPRGAKPNYPKPSKEAIARVDRKIERLGLLGKKFVIIAPETNSLVEMKPEFWENLSAGLYKKGYDVFLNAYYSADIKLLNAKSARTTIEEMLALAQKSDGIITLGSGLSVFLAATGVKMDVIYTDYASKSTGYDSALVIQIYSVFHIPGVSKELVKEYDTGKMTDKELLETILKRY
jgi:ADP-heptose:LPS heptosyltransferase